MSTESSHVAEATSTKNDQPDRRNPRVSLYSGTKSVHPSRARLRELLAEHARPGEPRLDGSEAAAGAFKATAPLWSPHKLREGSTRSDAAVESLSCLVFDLDHGTHDLALFDGLAHLGHETPRSSDAEPRWRIAVFTTRDMTPGEYAHIWQVARSRYAPTADTQCQNPGRHFYTPPPGVEVLEQAGELLDVDALLAEPLPPTAAVAAPALPLAVVGGWPHDTADDPETLQALDEALAALPLVDRSGQPSDGDGDAPYALALLVTWRWGVSLAAARAALGRFHDRLEQQAPLAAGQRHRRLSRVQRFTSSTAPFGETRIAHERRKQTHAELIEARFIPPDEPPPEPPPAGSAPPPPRTKQDFVGAARFVAHAARVVVRSDGLGKPTAFVWRDAAYRELAKEGLDVVIRQTLPERSAYHSPTFVNATLRALLALPEAQAESDLCWLPGAPPAARAFDLTGAILFGNGLLLQTGALVPSTPALFCAREPLAANYNPDAVSPTLQSILEPQGWTEATAEGRALQEFLGASLVDNLPLHYFLWLFGVSRSGKGTLLRGVARVLGGLAATFAMSGIGRDTHETAQLAHARLAIDPDNREQPRERGAAQQFLLRVAGGDQFSARVFGGSIQRAGGSMLLACASNRRFSLGAEDTAIGARALCIEAKHSFFEGAADLDARLGSELDGVAAWLLRGLRRLQARGGRLELPESSRQAVTAAALDDTWVSWIDESFTPSADAEAPTLADIYQKARNHAADTGTEAPKRADLIQAVLDRAAQRGWPGVKQAQTPRPARAKVLTGLAFDPPNESGYGAPRPLRAVRGVS